MYNILKILTFFLTVTSTFHPVLAQEDQRKRMRELEIGTGFNFLGPGRQMADLMVEYGFDETAQSWFTGSDIKHPHYRKVGITGYLSCDQNIGQRSQLGIIFNYSFLNEVYGYSFVGGYLFVRFSNISLVALYSYGLNKHLEVNAGPVLMINSGNETSEDGQGKDKYTRLSPGLLTGLNLKIWNGRVTFGKIGTYYLLTTKNKMGPYSTDFSAIPESKINFSYLTVLFAFGLKF